MKTTRQDIETFLYGPGSDLPAVSELSVDSDGDINISFRDERMAAKLLEVLQDNKIQALELNVRVQPLRPAQPTTPPYEGDEDAGQPS